MDEFAVTAQATIETAGLRLKLERDVSLQNKGNTIIIWLHKITR
jgi:hypothetical protein